MVKGGLPDPAGSRGLGLKRRCPKILHPDPLTQFGIWSRGAVLLSRANGGPFFRRLFSGDGDVEPPFDQQVD
jgi:hypothetical protein